MEQRERTMKKGATKVTAIALAIAAVMALALCGCASQGDTSKSDIPAGLTDADSPATISQNDPAFAEFWSELLQYKKVADLDVQNAEIVTDITAVEAATAREDSTQTNYRYAIKSATMTVNGKTITYDASKGFSA